MTDDFAKQFVKDRNEAFIDFVLTGSMKKFNAYAKKYNILTCPDKTIQAAAIYKAVQECTNIPDDVKEIARKKCVELGFTPYMFQ